MIGRHEEKKELEKCLASHQSEFVIVCGRRRIGKTIGTDVYTWRCLADEDTDKGAQIDMVIERSDRTIHLCEIKFIDGEYNIKAEYVKTLNSRRDIFRDRTKTKKTIVHTFVTTYGLGEGKHYSIVHSEVTMDDLFNS